MGSHRVLISLGSDFRRQRHLHRDVLLQDFNLIPSTTSKILHRNGNLSNQGKKCLLPPEPELWLPGQDPGRPVPLFQRLENSVLLRVQGARQDQPSGEKVRGAGLHHPTHPICPPCLKSGQGQFEFLDGENYLFAKFLSMSPTPR